MQQPQRYIAHFDLDSFFYSVEELNNPSLKGKPVIVGGSRERGVVTTCSYEARKYGVRSAMPMKQALQLCPHAILLKGTYGEYGRYSKWVTNIIAAKAPLFQKASVDEFYIDLTGMDKYFNVLEWACKLREEIINETGLPISFGLASNKFVAKIATDEAKPNGFLFIQPGKEQDFLSPLPVSKIPGVGAQLQNVFRALRINTIGDIANQTKEFLEENIGKYGIDLWYRAQGIHYGEVNNYREAKSISTENTFDENKTDVDFLLKELVRMTEKIAYELRQDEVLCSCVAVKIRYKDFETTSKQTTIPVTCMDDELIPVAKKLFNELYRKDNAVRLLGVRLSNFTNKAIQANLFSNIEKKTHLYKAIDSVKDKYGKGAVKKGRVV